MQTFFKNAIIFIIVFYNSFSFCQDTLYFTNENSTRKYRVISLSSDANDIHKLNTWLGINLLDDDMMAFGGTSFFLPRKAIFELTYGSGLRYQGTIFFFNKEKNSRFNHSLDTRTKNGYFVKYIADLPTGNLSSLGFHYGAGHSDFFKVEGSTVNHARVGLTFLRSRYGNYLINSGYEKRKLNRRSSFSADLLYYFGHDKDFYKSFFVNYESLTEQEIEEVKRNDYRKIGFSLSYEGYIASWNNKTGIPGFRYMIGIGQSGFKSSDFFFRFGLGLNLSFLDKKFSVQGN